MAIDVYLQSQLSSVSGAIDFFTLMKVGFGEPPQMRLLLTVLDQWLPGRL